MSSAYYLATTALYDLLDIEACLVLLGSWCLTKNSLEHLLDGKHYSIVTSPWYPTIQRKNAVAYREELNEIFENPKEWWHSNTVQNARKEFCDRFAYARKDWLDVWVRELRKFI